MKYPQNKETIRQASWSSDEDRVLIASSEEVPPKDFEKEFDKNFGKNQQEREKNQTENVKIEVLKYDFLNEKGSVAKLFKTLAGYDDEKIFRNKAIDIIVTRVWNHHYIKIRNFVFFPYVAFCCCFLGYMIFSFQLEEDTTIVKQKQEQWALLSLSIVYSCYQLYFECKQMVNNPTEYFFSQRFIWNFLDIASSCLVITVSIVVLGIFDIGNAILVIGGLASFTVWIKLFYFLRIFRPTSSFIRMIVEMIKDIRIFLLIFFIAIFAFANFYYVIEKGNKNEKVIADFDGDYAGALVYTYMQALGELGNENFGKSAFPILYWIIFFMSTILLTITMLNLLIAIMGDTYDRVQEVAQEAQAKEICSFIEEYSFLFPENEFLKAPITIIARLERVEEEEGNAWEGKIGALKTFLGRQLKQQEEEAQKERKQIEEKQDRARQETEKKIEQLKTETKEIKEGLVKTEQQIKEGQARIEAKLEVQITNQMNEMKEHMKEIKALLIENQNLKGTEQLR